jgi:hypothetical protein
MLNLEKFSTGANASIEIKPEVNANASIESQK